MSNNVMAFEEYGDQYVNYANDMANDNYYKSQSNDIIKKIKCNNINSNFNGVEANIGTDDSLGEVGDSFFQDDASANAYRNGERNNGSFDVDCINNNNNVNNNEGGQSEEALSFYRVEGPLGNSTLGSTVADSTARCDEGDIAVGGGYLLFPTSSTATVSDMPEDAINSDGWRAFATAPSVTTEILIIATAQCLDNPPLRTSIAAVSSVQQQLEDSLVISQVTEDSPIISQQIGNSPALTATETQPEDSSSDLTATEKITKLKQQWLDLLP